jgi:hypothetical protein
MIIIDKFELAYLHINKTAGTSIRKFLEDLAGPSQMKQMGPTHGPLAPNLRFMGQRFYDYKILVSIRNPRARLISIYLFRKTRYEEGDQTPPTIAAHELPFKQWFLEVVRDSDRLTDLSITDSVLVGGDLPKNVHIVAVETLEKDLLRFCRDILEVKTNIQVPHLNKTNFVRDHYTKYFDKELTKAVYEWDQWVIDEYYPWFMDNFE